MADEASVAQPTLVSLLICDQVIDDKLTNKKSAIGLFNTVLVPKVPTVMQQVAVMASLTEITGRVPAELRLVRDADNSVLFSTRGHVDAPNPLATVDLVFTMQGVRLPAPGQFAFELLCGGALLGRRRFQLVVRPPQRRGAPPRPPSGPGPPGQN
ncbi:MAG: hypothetical protein KKB50_09625 [Planctomycetes bacterium]|nr:hypothetical protein [Planctomycetota bacterium]